MRIPMEDWLRGCVYHDGRHGEVTLSTDKVLEIANYIQLTRTSLADGMIELPPYDRKTEPQTYITEDRTQMLDRWQTYHRNTTSSVTPCSNCQEFDCYGCEYNLQTERSE